MKIINIVVENIVEMIVKKYNKIINKCNTSTI